MAMAIAQLKRPIIYYIILYIMYMHSKAQDAPRSTYHMHVQYIEFYSTSA
jgi:hypothetical protein